MPPPPILVTFALPQESSDFREALRRRRHESVRVEHFGVGPARAAERIGRLLAMEKPRLLICAGFAGGLGPRLPRGEIIVGENLSTPALPDPARGRTGEHNPFRFCPILSRTTP